MNEDKKESMPLDLELLRCTTSAMMAYCKDESMMISLKKQAKTIDMMMEYQHPKPTPENLVKSMAELAYNVTNDAGEELIIVELSDALEVLNSSIDQSTPTQTPEEIEEEFIKEKGYSYMNPTVRNEYTYYLVDKIANQPKPNVTDSVSFTYCVVCDQGVYVDGKCNNCGADKLTNPNN